MSKQPSPPVEAGPPIDPPGGPPTFKTVFIKGRVERSLPERVADKLIAKGLATLDLQPKATRPRIAVVLIIDDVPGYEIGQIAKVREDKAAQLIADEKAIRYK